MLGFLKSKRAVRTGPVLRSFLRLEELGVRAMPTDMGNPPPPTDPPPAFEMPPPSNPQPPTPPAQMAPFIDEFGAEEVAHGWYTITGHVTATNPGGLIVSFAGIPALAGKTAIVAADGSYILTFQVATNGSDIGTISAQTSQNGMQSNLALTYISPTP